MLCMSGDETSPHMYLREATVIKVLLKKVAYKGTTDSKKKKQKKGAEHKSNLPTYEVELPAASLKTLPRAVVHDITIAWTGEESLMVPIKLRKFSPPAAFVILKTSKSNLKPEKKNIGRPKVGLKCLLHAL